MDMASDGELLDSERVEEGDVDDEDCKERLHDEDVDLTTSKP